MQHHGMGSLTHWAYTANAVAAIASPFWSAESQTGHREFRGSLPLFTLGAGRSCFVPPSTINRPIVFLTLLLAYNLLYMPTLGLANTVVFRHLDNPETQFPVIRVFGTAGWIVAGLFISFVLPAIGGNAAPEATASPLYTAGLGSLILGVYSLTLPRARLVAIDVSPMASRGSRRSPLTRIVDRNMLIFLGSILLICIPLAAYYNFTQLYLQVAGFQKIAAVQTLGQCRKWPSWRLCHGSTQSVPNASLLWVCSLGLFDTDCLHWARRV